MDSFEFKKQWEIGERPDWAAALPFDWGETFKKFCRILRTLTWSKRNSSACDRKRAAAVKRVCVDIHFVAENYTT